MQRGPPDVPKRPRPLTSWAGREDDTVDLRAGAVTDDVPGRCLETRPASERVGNGTRPRDEDGDQEQPHRADHYPRLREATGTSPAPAFGNVPRRQDGDGWPARLSLAAIIRSFVTGQPSTRSALGITDASRTGRIGRRAGAFRVARDNTTACASVSRMFPERVFGWAAWRLGLQASSTRSVRALGVIGATVSLDRVGASRNGKVTPER